MKNWPFGPFVACKRVTKLLKNKSSIISSNGHGRTWAAAPRPLEHGNHSQNSLMRSQKRQFFVDFLNDFLGRFQKFSRCYVGIFGNWRPWIFKILVSGAWGRQKPGFGRLKAPLVSIFHPSSQAPDLGTGTRPGPGACQEGWKMFFLQHGFFKPLTSPKGL